MPYNFDESKNELAQEIVQDKVRKQEIEQNSIDEPFEHLDDFPPFFASFIVTVMCYVLAFMLDSLANIYVKIGLGTYLAFPTLSMMLQMLISKPVKYRLNNGEIYIGKRCIHAEDIKSAAITEYSPCYMKNEKFTIPAINFSGYREFLVELMPRRRRAESVSFFMSNQDSANKLIKFLIHNQINYGHTIKEPRKFMFYY
ncbi:hypothetical protein IJF81_02460 [bacterium]|nr:hypothetical protein [bacterium]